MIEVKHNVLNNDFTICKIFVIAKNNNIYHKVRVDDLYIRLNSLIVVIDNHYDHVKIKFVSYDKSIEICDEFDLSNNYGEFESKEELLNFLCAFKKFISKLEQKYKTKVMQIECYEKFLEYEINNISEVCS